MSEIRVSRRTRGLAVALAAATLVVTFVGTAVAPAAVRHARAQAGSAKAATGPYVTLLFSRTEQTAADNCVAANTGVAQLTTTVAPYLKSLGDGGDRDAHHRQDQPEHHDVHP